MNSKKSDNRVYPLGYEPPNITETTDHDIRNHLLNFILKSGPTQIVDTDLFTVMANRRSTRRFADKPVETAKIDKIIAAADTAPTAGNYQGFEIFYIKGPDRKKLLIDACNRQPYVDAPVVLVFCKNPSRVKFDFPEYVLKKFAIQDATLAAAYSQLAAHALGLASIWIGMLDEQKVMNAVGTNLVPSSILCIGYPKQTKFPKPRRHLKDIVHVRW